MKHFYTKTKQIHTKTQTQIPAVLNSRVGRDIFTSVNASHFLSTLGLLVFGALIWKVDLYADKKYKEIYLIWISVLASANIKGKKKRNIKVKVDKTNRAKPVWAWVFVVVWVIVITMDPNHYQRSSLAPGVLSFCQSSHLWYSAKHTFKDLKEYGAYQTTMWHWWWKRLAPFIFTNPLHTGPGRVCTWVEVDQCSLRKSFKSIIALEMGFVGWGVISPCLFVHIAMHHLVEDIPLTSYEIPKIYDDLWLQAPVGWDEGMDWGTRYGRLNGRKNTCGCKRL